MSTSTFPSLTVTVSSQPSQTDGGNGGGGGNGMQRGANYFFGFLITFVALLLIFVGCGIGSRRRFAHNRAQMLRQAALGGSTTGGWDAFGNSQSGATAVPQVEPTFWEPTLEKGGHEWGTIQPLAILTTRGENATKPSPIPTSRPRDFARRIEASLPLWAQRAASNTTSRKQTALDAEAGIGIGGDAPPTPPGPEAVHVAVVIAMPAPPRQPPISSSASTTSLLNSKQPPDKIPDQPVMSGGYEIGVASIPWLGGPIPHPTT